MLKPQSSESLTLKLRLDLLLAMLFMVLGWVAFAIMTVSPYTAYASTYVHTVFPQLYSFFARRLPANWSNPTLPDNGARLLIGCIFWVLICVIWIAYLAATRLIARGLVLRIPFVKSPLVPILLFGVLLGATTTFWVTMHSTDLYTYAIEGKIQLAPGGNALIDPHSWLAGDPVLRETAWPTVPSMYGPVWIGAETAIAWLLRPWGGTPVAFAFGFRLFAQLLMALSTILIWAITGRLGWDTPRRAAATALFGWCPLLIVEMAGNGHNDMALVFFLLLAIYLHLRGAWPLVVAALVCCALVKFTALIFLPAYVLLLIRGSSDRVEAAGRVLTSGLLAAGLVVLGYAPFADPRLIYTMLHNPLSNVSANTTSSVVATALADLAMALRGSLLPAGLTVEQANAALQSPTFLLPFAIWGILALIATLRVRDFAGLLGCWGFLAFSYMTIGSAWFWPWYAAWVVPFVALLPDSILRRASLWFLFGASLTYGGLPFIAFVDFQHRYYVLAASSFLPLWLYGIWLAGRWLLGRRRRTAEASLPFTKLSA